LSKRAVLSIGLSEDFEAGIPASWSASTTNNDVAWQTSTAASFETNYAHTSNVAAMACSDCTGTGTGPYDASLLSPLVAIPADATGASLAFDANFQYNDIGRNDCFEVYVRTDDDVSWSSKLSWKEDHGGERSLPGESVSLNLSADIAGKNTIQLRFRYYNFDNGFDYYVQIDNVAVVFHGMVFACFRFLFFVVWLLA
jgi:hypothetical protein